MQQRNCYICTMTNISALCTFHRACILKCEQNSEQINSCLMRFGGFRPESGIYCWWRWRWHCQEMTVWSPSPPLYWCWAEDPRAQRLKERRNGYENRSNLNYWTSHLINGPQLPCAMTKKNSNVQIIINIENQVDVKGHVWSDTCLAKAMQCSHTQLLSQGLSWISRIITQEIDQHTKRITADGKMLNDLIVCTKNYWWSCITLSLRYFKPAAATEKLDRPF